MIIDSYLMNEGEFYNLPLECNSANFVQLQLRISNEIFPYVVAEENKTHGKILEDFLKCCNIEPDFIDFNGENIPKKMTSLYMVMGAGILSIASKDIFFYKGKTPYGNNGPNTTQLRTRFSNLGYKLKMVGKNKMENLN